MCPVCGFPCAGGGAIAPRVAGGLCGDLRVAGLNEEACGDRTDSGRARSSGPAVDAGRCHLVWNTSYRCLALVRSIRLEKKKSATAVRFNTTTSSVASRVGFHRTRPSLMTSAPAGRATAANPPSLSSRARHLCYRAAHRSKRTLPALSLPARRTLQVRCGLFAAVRRSQR